MITKRGLHPLVGLATTVVLVAVGILVVRFVAELAPTLISYQDGNKMSVYANTVTASDGKKYRVTITTHFEPGKKSTRIIDAYSLDSEYASITGFSEVPALDSWTRFYVCSMDEINAHSCHRDPTEAVKILDELAKKTIVRSNSIGNFEIYWSWSVGTKDLINKIKRK